MPNQLWQSVEKLLHADQYFVMIGVECPGCLTGILELTVGSLAISDREGLYFLCNHPLHHSGDRTRIDSAAEKHAERHVAHQPHADRLFHATATVGDPLFIGPPIGVR